MVVHGEITLGEILKDETLLWLVASDLRLKDDALVRKLKKAIAGIYSEDTSLDELDEDGLRYVPAELWDTTVGDALKYDDVASIAEWTGLSEREVLAELKDADKRTKVSKVFTGKWPAKSKALPKRKTKAATAKVSKVKATKAKVSKVKATKAKVSKAATPTLPVLTTSHAYQFAFTFAGEDRPVVKSLAENLTAQGISVFYDEFEADKLWGKDLYEYLADIYRHKARFCIMVISKHYAAKVGTSHERKAAQARAFADSREYFLPQRLDDTEIPGIHHTVGYLDLRKRSIDDVVKLALMKMQSS